MRFHTLSVALVAALGITLTGCDDGAPLTGAELAPRDIEASLSGASIADGGGVFDAGVPVHFAFGAVQRDASGAADGQLRFATEVGGLAIEFHGAVTCMTSDLEHGRTWIGGVVTRNASEHPAFTGDVHQVGRDIWFRAVDYGEGATASQADRTTFVGFEGSAGIITSEEYCEVKPWPDNDERTGPVLEGNIQVR